nr:MAG TPA: hypothetical protein [Caudoviricetes sp.]
MLQRAILSPSQYMMIYQNSLQMTLDLILKYPIYRQSNRR